MNFGLQFGPAHLGVTHLWSLAVEEQFYLVWPLFLAIVLTAFSRPSPLKLFAYVTGAATVVVLARDLFGVVALYHFRFDALLYGCSVAILYSSRHRPVLARICCSPVVSATAVTLLVFEIARPPVITLPIGPRVLNTGAVIVEASVAVILVWLAEGAPGLRPLRWLLETPPLVYMGRISYALYLWHMFVITALLWYGVRNETELRLIGIGGAFLIASISYYAVERPFLRVKWRLSRTESHDVSASEAVQRGLAAQQRLELSQGGAT